MNWTQMKVGCSVEDLDRVTAIMSMLDPQLMVEDYSDMDEGMNNIYGELIDESLKNADRKHAAVSLFIPESKTPGDYAAFARDRFRAENIDATVEMIGIADDDWENSWKKYYNPIRVGEKIMIVPAWQTFDAAPDDVVVTMDPGLAFGSGTHETTRLCASLIEKYLTKGDRVLDVGTGSGILAIIESKLGAAVVDACDIDPVAVRVAQENAESNGVANVNCFVSDLLASVDAKGGMYDFVSANIVSDIIIRMTPDLPRIVRPNGLVAVSGVIDEYAPDVIAAMDEQGFGVADVYSDNGWKGLLFRRIRTDSYK
ncbi:MAG: 50S ribosomal protein L11 methyltransferase [Clostridia bacterium]|nr:50S ribosomal protein L11 methyltransferase [Clostridia bacterium]